MIKKICALHFKILVFFLISLVACAYEGFQSSLLSLSITSDQLIDYYKKDPDLGVSDIYLRSEYQEQTKKFNDQEVTVPIKGEHWGTDHVDSKIRYYEISHFKIGDYLYKLIIYNRDGEADTPLLNIQLNSYNVDGVLIDALLLDSRFSYEEIENFYEFSINKNNTIDINRYVIRRYGVDENGDIGDEIENPVPEHYAKEQYKINEGYFRLITQ